MEINRIYLKPATNDDFTTIEKWFYNPVIAFLAFPNVDELKFETFFHNFISPENTLIIKKGNETVGCLVIDFKKTIRIHCVYIVPKYRGNKYAKDALLLLMDQIPNTDFYALIHNQQREHENLFLRSGFSKTDDQFEFQFENKSHFLTKFIH